MKFTRIELQQKIWLTKIPCCWNAQTLCQQKFDKRKKEAAMDD